MLDEAAVLEFGDSTAAVRCLQRQVALRRRPPGRYGEEFLLHGSQVIHRGVCEERREIGVGQNPLVELDDEIGDSGRAAEAHVR